MSPISFPRSSIAYRGPGNQCQYHFLSCLSRSNQDIHSFPVPTNIPQPRVPCHHLGDGSLCRRLHDRQRSLDDLRLQANQWRMEPFHQSKVYQYRGIDTRCCLYDYRLEFCHPGATAANRVEVAIADHQKIPIDPRILPRYIVSTFYCR